MPRLIDADALLEILRKDATEKLRFFDPKYEGYITAMAKVEEIVEDILPTIDPVKHGRWETEIRTIYGAKIPFFACSECGKNSADTYHYCPNCGARMEGEEEKWKG